MTSPDTYVGRDQTAASTPRVGRRRRRRPSVQRMLFSLLFLGVPLAVYLTFVESPFLQSFYHSLTNWSGLSPSMDVIGLVNYERILGDAVFWRSLRNNLILLIVLPVVTITLAFALAVMVTIGGSTHGGVRGVRGAGVLSRDQLLPVRGAGRHYGHTVQLHLRPRRRAAQWTHQRSRGDAQRHAAARRAGRGVRGPQCLAR